MTPTGRERALIEAARREAAAWVAPTELPPPSRPASSTPLPESFDGYRILGEIHRGGQGVVYLARQTAARRDVAIKVTLDGPFADAADRARFEREVHILARLRHPNIVTVYDTGEASGHDYYVMDYIAGRQLDAWVREQRPTVPATLERFVTICDAVNAAHVRGIIHRDLKPGNIRIDDDGEPHVLDFGLAKHAAGPPETAMTETGQFVGSLPWASPEQVRGDSETLDLRSDVYSLGVMLYQALTDRFPYDVVGPLRDVLANIAEAEPVRPRTLRREIDDDVETIVLKCLDKDPARRYQTAGDLARDIRRSLAGEPIEAKSDSGLYVLRKTLRRHRVAAAVAAGFAIVLMVATVMLAIAYGEARAQRDRAGRTAQRSADMLVSLLERYDMFDPFRSSVPDAGVLEVLDGLAETVEVDLADQPELAADCLVALGLSHLKIGQAREAEGHLVRALEIRRQALTGPHRDIADSLHNLGRALFMNSRLDEAAARYSEAVSMHVALEGPRSAAAAESMHHRAACLRRLGELQEAETQLRQVLEIRRETLDATDPFIAATLNNLATCLRDQGRFDEAEQLFDRALARIRERDDPNPLFLARGLRNLATCVLARGEIESALTLLDEARAILDPIRDDDHPDMAELRYHEAACRHARGDLAEAERLGRAALNVQARRLVLPHARVADTKTLLGLVLLEDGRLDEAATLVDDALRTRAALGGRHPDRAVTWYAAARISLARGAVDEAERYCRQALQVQQGRLVEMHPARRRSEQLLETLLERAGGNVTARTDPS